MKKIQKGAKKETGNSISEFWKGYNKEEILEGFDDVMKKVKKRKVPKWDRIG